MKKNLSFTLLALSAIALVACGGTSSVSSAEESSAENPWNFSETSGNRRILAEWNSHRTFDVGENGSFEPTDLLNPTQFTESSTSSSSESSGSSESSETSSEPVDYSDEVITFSASQDETLKNAVTALPLGELTSSACEGLISVLDTNDDFITRSTIVATETILYYNFLYASYDEGFNYHKTETFEKKRYDNNITEGLATADILYPDGYTIDYTEKEQIYGDAFNVNLMHREYFPKGLSSHATNYKVTTPREEGSLKAAVNVGGGLPAKTWINRYSEMYTNFSNPESPDYNVAYSFEISGTKSADLTTIAFTSHRGEFVHPIDGIYYDMILNYEVSITDGVVSAIDTYQQYTTNPA